MNDWPVQEADGSSSEEDTDATSETAVPMILTFNFFYKYNLDKTRTLINAALD